MLGHLLEDDPWTWPVVARPRAPTRDSTVALSWLGRWTCIAGSVPLGSRLATTLRAGLTGQQHRLPRASGVPEGVLRQLTRESGLEISYRYTRVVAERGSA
jgi:hypothetical protein